MRETILLLIVTAALMPVPGSGQTPPSATPAPAAHRATLSYALGYEAGLDLGKRNLNIDIAGVVRGVKDGYARKHPDYSPREMREVIVAVQRKMLDDARAAFDQLAVANLSKAREFFTDNGKRQGIVTLPSGVQYKVIDDGKGGRSPAVGSQVTLQYRGAFLDGTVFDNTDDRGRPVVFPVEQMIPGWRDVITRMHVGDHWQVFIPPDQAYGVRGEPPRIGPNEALVFDIRLLDVGP